MEKRKGFQRQQGGGGGSRAAAAAAAAAPAGRQGTPRDPRLYTHRMVAPLEPPVLVFLSSAAPRMAGGRRDDNYSPHDGTACRCRHAHSSVKVGS